MMSRHCLPILFLVIAAARCDEVANSSSSSSEKEGAIVVVSKCCPVDSVLVETSLGQRECQSRNVALEEDRRQGRWSPVFFDLASGHEVMRPASYELISGFPACDAASEARYPVYHHEHTLDDMMLLKNGSLSHQLVHEGKVSSPRKLFPPSKYCLEDMIVKHNATGAATGNEDAVEFAFVCVDRNANLQDILDHYIYPIGLCVSIACLLLTFLLYSFLPQLRDLTGKFILAICAFLCAVFALCLVEVLGRNDSNVSRIITELLLHTGIVGIWFSLSAMGHHVWKIIHSRTVFTRVTDGTKLMLYSIYVVAGCVAVAGLALSAHYILSQGEGLKNREIGWVTVMIFYVPTTILLLLCVYFYWTSQRKITKQMMYNRSMQHFQVNFDLFTKFLLVLGIWWLFFMLALLGSPALVYISKVFNVIEGPLIFCVAMCRTRVAFLFKRYFCYDSCCFGCCKSEEFINEDCKEMTTIDALRQKASADEADGGSEADCMPHHSLLSAPFSTPGTKDRELSKSLFNVRNQTGNGEVPPPPDPDMPVGRVKRLLKSNSLTAIANLNFGWRRETSV